MWLLAVRATSDVVARLITLIAYRLFVRLFGRGFVSRLILVPVIPRAVVPVVSVLAVPFGADTGVFQTCDRTRPVRRAFSLP